MRNGSLILCSSTTLVNTASAAVKGWTGGRGALVVSANAYPTALHLELNWNGTWIRVNTSNIAANQVMALNLPAGEYRMAVSGSTVVGLSAALCPTP